MHKIELSQNTTNNHQNDAGLCSPFCVCYCCTSQIIHQVIAIQVNCFSFTQKHYPVDKSCYISILYSTIWEPPKLV